MLYVILVTLFLIGQPMSSGNPARKLSLSQELFPNAELIWSRTFEGKMIDFDIAKKSGHVVIGAVNNLEGSVYLFSPNGELLWVKESEKHSEIEKCAGIKISISDSAETIGIFWWGDYEREEDQFYDNSGEKLYSCKHGMTGGIGMEISPGGGYAKATSLMDRRGKEILLRNILKDFPIEKLRKSIKSINKHIIRKADGTYSTEYTYRYKKITNFEFISENEIAVFLDSTLYLYSFPAGELKWESNKLEKLELRISKEIAPVGQNILLGGGRKLYCFSKDGELLWETELDRNLYYYNVSTSTDMKYIVIHISREILLIDSETGEIKLNVSELKSQVGVESFSVNSLSCLSGKVLLSGYSGGSSTDAHKGYWTYILQFDENWNIVDESWENGLVLGNPGLPVIGVYESDATDRTRSSHNEGVRACENSTVFVIDILKLKD